MHRILKCLFVLSLLVTSGHAEKETKKKEVKAVALPVMAMGSKKAPVIVINYSSLTCTHCAEFHKDTLPKIEEKYIKPGLVRMVFRDYPGDQLSLMAHQLAWCKGQMKYFSLMDVIFSTQEEWLTAPDPKVALKAILVKHGISGDQFDACLKNQGLLDDIINERLQGQTKYKIEATPTLIVNGKIYPEALPFDQFAKAVDPFLGKDKEKNKDPKKDNKKSGPKLEKASSPPKEAETKEGEKEGKTEKKS